MPRHTTPDLDYIAKLYAPQDALLAEIDRVLQERGTAIHVSAVEGSLLQLLIRLHGVRRIVEIGTLAGYSAIWMARALPQDGQIVTLEKDAAHAALARSHFARSEVSDRILLLEGDAQTSLESLEAQAPFDMVFIDADKPSYNHYLDWAERQVRRDGLIVADNTLLFGSAAMEAPPSGIAFSTWREMRRFNERLADRERYFATMIPTQEGLSVAVKRF